MATPDDTIEGMAVIVRRIVSRELSELDMKIALSDDDVDRLAKLALVLQRIRQPGKTDPEATGADGKTDQQLMRAANG